MKIEEDGTVVFKSEPYNFKAEMRGFKPNIVRLLTKKEAKILLVNEKEEHPTFSCDDFKPKRIRIECTDLNLKGYDSFVRDLTDIRKIGELCGSHLFVFSWCHWLHPSFVDEVIVLKEAINDMVSDPETKRRIYNRASELMEKRKEDKDFGTLITSLIDKRK